jgi:hypothetical protein
MYLLDNPFERLQGRMLLYVLQQFLEFIQAYYLAGQEEDLTLDVHALIEYMNTMWEHPLGKNASEIFWAIPGFTCFFLSEDRFLSPSMKQLKLDESPPPPKEVYFKDGTLDTATKQNAAHKLPSHSSMFVFNFLQRSAFSFVGATLERLEGGVATRGVVQITGFGAAVERRILESWLCPYSRVSFQAGPMSQYSDDNASRTSIFETTLTGMFRRPMDGSGGFIDPALAAFSSRKWKKPHEVMCGISVKEAFRIFLEDEHFLPNVHSSGFIGVIHSLDSLYTESKPDEAPWSSFSFADRIELLEFYHEEERFVAAYGETRTNGGKYVTISLLEYWRAAVVGFSAKCIMGVHDKLVDLSRSGRQVDVKTTEYIKEKHKTLLDTARPTAYEYLNAVEPVYVRRQKLAKEPAQPFPSELVDHIASFLVHPDLEWPELFQK